MTKSKPRRPPAKPKPTVLPKPRRRRRVDLRFDARAAQLPAGEREEEAPSSPPPGTRRPPEDDPDDDLGPIMLPAPEEARRVLGELAALYDERFIALRRYKGLKRMLKEAAEAVAGLDTRIAERLRVTTHRSGLPLLHEMDDEREPGSDG